jgi:hypothetical protein
MKMHYVTAIAIPRGAASLEGLPRTEMAKFFTRADAETHMATRLSGPGFADVRIEEREEGEAT